jgi:hypothetical protein
VQNGTAGAEKGTNGRMRQISAASGADFGRDEFGPSFFAPYGQKQWYYYY